MGNGRRVGLNLLKRFFLNFLMVCWNNITTLVNLPWIHSVHERWRTVRTHGSMRRSVRWTMRTHWTVRRHGRMHAGWRTMGSKVRRTRWPHELMVWRWTSGWHWSTHMRRRRSWTHHAWRWRPVLWSEGKR